MKTLIFIFYYCILAMILNSCSSLDDAGKVLRNEKMTGVDEFLIKKKNPLTLPPDYEKIPMPGAVKSKAEKNEEDIKKILKKKQSETVYEKSTSTEKSIINQIKK